MFRFRTFRILCGGVLIVFMLATCAVGLSIWKERTDAIENAVKDAHNIAVVLGGQIARSVQSIDIVLRELQKHIDGLTEPGTSGFPVIRDPERFRNSLLLRLQYLPQAFSVAVADYRGQVVATTATWRAPDINVADREYFQELQAHDDDRLSISLPLRNRVSGELTVNFARRINGPDHGLLGIVFVTVTLQHFEQIYGAIEPLRDQAFFLVRRDGTSILRYPDTVDRAGSKVLMGPRWHDAVRNGGGSFRSTGIFDAVQRWVAVYVLTEYPLVVNIAIPEHVILENWLSHAIAVIVATLVLLTCAVVLLLIMARQFRNLSASEMALQREHAELLTQNQRFDAALNNMSQGLAMFDAEARLVVCNDRYLELCGLSAERVKPGCTLREILRARQEATGFPNNLEQYLTEVIASASRRESVTHEDRYNDGRIIQVMQHPMQNGGWVGTHEDITERRNSESKIKFLAHNDPLTGLANRADFVEQIDKASERLRTAGEPFCVLMLDIDRLKVINDSLGHAAGDALLIETAKRMRKILGPTDVLARLGGDEFAIIQTAPGESDGLQRSSANMRERAVVLATRIIDVIGKPYDVDGHKVVIGSCIGIAVAPDDAVDPADLMKKADLALYKTKSKGRNGYAFFDAGMTVAADERHRLETDLREALSRNELELYYQPEVNVGTQQPCCMEALIRWHHPKHGLVSPDRFISLAEDTELIISLGAWILRTACAEAVHWPSHIKVAVNISPIQFRRTNLFDVITCALIETGLPADRLEVEITERVLLEKDTDHLAVLRKLKSIGVSIALDDFGTGYSSLSYLNMFPFDKIKIDKSFVDELLKKPACAAIVCAITNLGRSLDIITTAEGVESEEQFQALRAAGLTQAQGFLFGRPVPVSEILFDKSDKDCAEQANPHRRPHRRARR